MSVYQTLFSPFQLGRLELRNRIVMPPMGTNLATRRGEVTDRMIDYYVDRAEGGPGLIVVEGTAVHASGRAYPLMLDLGRDELIEGFARLAAAIHDQGAAVILQLFHGGRHTDTRVSGRTPLAPSPIRGPVGRITPEEMSLDQIELMVEAFGRAAERAVEAGFDGVEIHGAHEYLVHQFISPYCNQRTDAYGGSADNRLRFALEIVRRIKHNFHDIILSFRFNANDYVAGGLGLEDTPALAQKLVEAGVDLLSVTGGVFETPHLLIPPLPVAHGTHLPLARAIKAA
ncbi:MAG: NADH:flavin oxidoreductase, partial [Proteobacteria bacterium]|nr:NADH:flavin oxidoreductase [Pseudomonadota bacterium]